LKRLPDGVFVAPRFRSYGVIPLQISHSRWTIAVRGHDVRMDIARTEDGNFDRGADLGQLAGEIFGQSDDAVLRDEVAPHPRRGDQARQRCGVHDVALGPLTKHDWDERAYAVDATPERHACSLYADDQSVSTPRYVYN